jgi:hypothetical protein
MNWQKIQLNVTFEQVDAFPDEPIKPIKHAAIYEIIRNAEMDKPYLITLPEKQRWSSLSQAIFQIFRKARVPYSIQLRKTEYGPVQTKFYFRKVKRTNGISAAVNKSIE